NEALAIPEQTAAGKETSNPLMADSLPITILIVDFLNAQLIRYALMVKPTIYVSCIKQFWATVSIKKVKDVVKLQALIDKNKVIVTEDIIRQDLRLDNVDGVDCLPNEEIFTKLGRMGYEKPPPKLTFYKASSMASAVICLAIGRKFNFSKYIFSSMAAAEEENKEDAVSTSPTPPSSTHEPTPPLQEPITSPQQAQSVTPPQSSPQAQSAPPSSPPQEQPTITSTFDMSLLNTLLETCTTLSHKVAALEQDKKLRKVGTSQRVESSTETVVGAELQGRLEEKYEVNVVAKEVNVVAKEVNVVELIVFDDEEVRPIFKREYNKVQTFLKHDRDKEHAKKRGVEETILYESFKKLRAEVKVLSSHSVQDTPTNDPKEMSEEDVQNMLQIVPVSEFKVEAL
nr:hypothetical protein [Tanacetum cinerariifolium]